MRYTLTKLICCAGIGLIIALAPVSPKETKPLKVLKEICDEVKELGPYPGEDFIRREFFIGNEDDDDTYKNQHVVVLIQDKDGLEKVNIQVTYMEAKKDNPQVKYARYMKNIVCLIKDSEVTVQGSDYNERELQKLAAEILRAVQNKKKLLFSLSAGQRPSSGRTHPGT